MRPLPTDDREFEEVALRLAESGSLSDLVEALARVEHRETRESFSALAERFEEVLGRPVALDFDVVDYDESAAWWQAAFDERHRRLGGRA